ncbi:MAG TPA: BNR-4 repeat-containing protein, partial [Opitutales bacterium]|nr:BNR-4 repeat-containing protein [Opitutales bacterium]
PSTHAWSVVQSPLLEGAGQRSPYWWRPEISADGTLHLAWCWRETSNASTNHDLCYARSRDGGLTWENSAGKILTVPITAQSDATVFPIAQGQNLMNQCTLATDAQGRPHIAYYCNGPDGVPQYFHLWFDGEKWSAQQVSQRTLKFSLSGTGTLSIPISRPEIAVSHTGVAYLITRDAEFGGGVRLYAARPPYAQWQVLDVVAGPLGDWEPSYDLVRWRRDGVLSLFVLPVHQGNNERTTNFPPQTARVVELSGLE